VDSRWAKRTAEDLAEEIPGVRDVFNNLRIRSKDRDQPFDT
jgi:osmotically-inducible protein OsmY